MLKKFMLYIGKKICSQDAQEELQLKEEEVL